MLADTLASGLNRERLAGAIPDRSTTQPTGPKLEVLNLGDDTLLAKLDRLPPIMCRLLAKQNGRLLSDRQLQRITGWSNRKLCQVYRAKSWSHVAVEDVDIFLKACGLKWSTQRRERRHLQVAVNRYGLERMQHLRARTWWERQMIRSLTRHVRSILSQAVTP